MNTPDMLPVTSSNVSHIGYDPASRELHITFKSGGTYSYGNTSPEEFMALKSAPSIGKHIHAHIRPKHPVKKVS